MKLDVLQPALPSVQLALEHVDSEDYFQQLLSIDSALQALSLAKKSLTTQLRELGSQGPTAEPRAVEQSLTDLDTLIQRFEDLQTAARQGFNLRARSLRKDRLGILDLPNELLRKVFDSIRGDLEERNFQPDPDYNANSMDIQNIRLAHRAFRDASSHLLVRYIDLSPDRSSLERLEKVMRHPDFSRGDRILRIDMRYYSATISQSLPLFLIMCYQKLEETMHSLNLDYWSQWKSHETPRVPPGETEGAAAKARRVVRAWGRFINQHFHDDSDAEMLVRRGHERYRALFEEQEETLRGGHFARAVAAVMAMGHSWRRPSVWLYMSDHQGLPGYPHTRPVDLETTGMDELADMDHLIQSKFIERSPWRYEREHGEQEPTQSLLYELPLAMRAEGVSLAGFKVDINIPRTFNLHMSQDQLSGLEQVAKTLKFFGLCLCEDERNSGATDIENNQGNLEGLYTWLSAAIGWRNVPELSLSFDPVDRTVLTESFLSIGPLLTSPSWQRLRLADLSYMNMGIDDMRKFAGILEQGVCLRLDRIGLTSGTWVAALDYLHSKAGWGSYIVDPRGAECDVMYDEDVIDIFGDSSKPLTPISMVSLYIASVDGVENPLRGLNLGLE